MLIAAFIAYTTVILNLLLGIRVFQANRRAAANRNFLAMCVTLSFWGLGYAFMITAPDVQEANAWHIFSALGWCFFYSVFVQFALNFTNNRTILSGTWKRGFLHVPPLIYFLHTVMRTTEQLVHTEWGWVYLYTKEVGWQIGFIVYYSVYAMFAFWLIYRWGKKTQVTREKKQSQLLVRSMLTVYVLAVPFDTYLPLLGYPVLPVAILLSTLFIATSWYAITRYRLMTLNFNTAADHILQKMIDPVLLVDDAQIIREVNVGIQALTGWSEAEMIGKSLLFLLVEDHENQRADFELHCLTDGKKRSVFLTTHDLAVTIPCVLSSRVLRDKFGDMLGFIVMLHDISELKRYEQLLIKTNDELEDKVRQRTEELEEINDNLQQEIQNRKEVEAQALHRANFDALTGLPNRSCFYEKAQTALYKAQLLNECIAIVFFDLDNFKLLNDSYGHNFGDLILVEISRRLKHCLRSSDMLARIGGDEFLLLIEGVTSQDAIAKYVQSLKNRFDQPLLIDGRECFLSVSVGIAAYPMDGNDADTLLKNADVAMYAAKKDGKNSIYFCSEQMKQQTQENQQIRTLMFRAIERREFEVYYQPQVNIRTQKIIGFEALLRWRPEQAEYVSPSKFIPIAEETGLIVTIGQWVMQEAFAQLRRWHEAGFAQLTMAVNLSARQLREKDFDEQLATCIHQTGVDPHKIEMEITESMTFHKKENLISALGLIKKRGIAISIDDFGTEYSSFINVKEFPFDRLKIARPFISGIGKNKKDEAIVSSIIEIASKLGIRVIAEGVETAEELEYLLQEGCDEVQGYYYFRPMPAWGMDDLLK